MCTLCHILHLLSVLISLILLFQLRFLCFSFLWLLEGIYAYFLAGFQNLNLLS